MSNPAPGFSKYPQHQVAIAPIPEPVAISWAGRTIAQTQQALRVDESRHDTVVYVPLADIEQDCLRATQTSTYCPFKGHASYWSLVDGDREEPDALWAYEAPYDECLPLVGYGAFYADKVEVTIGDQRPT